MEITGRTYFDNIQGTLFTPMNQGKNMKPVESTQEQGQFSRTDRLELSPEGEAHRDTLHITDEVTIEIPRAWTIMGETMESHGNNLKNSLEKADQLNLSCGEHIEFIKNEQRKWVEAIRQNDPEMFVAWLKISQDHIQAGQPELAGLPSDFTMQDFYEYVK